MSTEKPVFKGARAAEVVACVSACVRERETKSESQIYLLLFFLPEKHLKIEKQSSIKACPKLQKVFTTQKIVQTPKDI